MQEGRISKRLNEKRISRLMILKGVKGVILNRKTGKCSEYLGIGCRDKIMVVIVACKVLYPSGVVEAKACGMRAENWRFSDLLFNIMPEYGAFERRAALNEKERNE